MSDTKFRLTLRGALEDSLIKRLMKRVNQLLMGSEDCNEWREGEIVQKAEALPVLKQLNDAHSALHRSHPAIVEFEMDKACAWHPLSLQWEGKTYALTLVAVQVTGERLECGVCGWWAGPMEDTVVLPDGGRRCPNCTHVLVLPPAVQD